MSMSGVVTALCISPMNGSRSPCEELQAKQSIVGDCQCQEGWATRSSAKIKNSGALLGDNNLFVESLLAAVSIGDTDIVQEVTSGARAPRLEKVWVTGDNVYVSGLDMSWYNFRVGDLLVMPNAVVVNTGYPHFACWKYAVRAGEQPKAYINSEDGVGLRMRGIKGAFLMPSSSIKTADSVRIVRHGTLDYDRVVQTCCPPLEAGTEVVFRMGSEELRVKAHDTKAYIDLLISAGRAAGRIDAANYKRTLPEIVREELGMAAEQAARLYSIEICAAALSGDGTTQNVGIKMDGQYKCPDCTQRFTIERASQLHWKFIHDPNRHHED